jgi:hypothetical protein
MKKSDAKEKLISSVAELWPFAKGSVRSYQQKCLKENCRRCASGEGHQVWQMTYYKDGRQRSRHIPRDLVDDFKKALENGRKVEALLVDAGLEYLDELRGK